MVTRVVGKVFVGDTIPVDGIEFEDCTFEGCRLVFAAEDTVSFSHCTFKHCNWTFDGPAERTLQYLSALFQGLGAEGQQLIEAIFQGIREGTVRKTPERSTVAAR